MHPGILPTVVMALAFANVSAHESSYYGELDRDRDGRLGRWEVSELPIPFETADANGDGYLSRDEFRVQQVHANDNAYVRNR